MTKIYIFKLSYGTSWKLALANANENLKALHQKIDSATSASLKLMPIIKPSNYL